MVHLHGVRPLPDPLASLVMALYATIGNLSTDDSLIFVDTVRLVAQKAYDRRDDTGGRPAERARCMQGVRCTKGRSELELGNATGSRACVRAS